MDWKFVCGILTAEASAQLALALALALAYWLARLKYEHLLFSALNFLIALQAFASLWLSLPAHSDPHRASVIVHAILAVATAIHLHYVVVITGIHKPRLYVVAGYGVAAIVVGLISSRSVWPRHPADFGLGGDPGQWLFPRLAAPPPSITHSFYPIVFIEFALCAWLLVWSARRGRKSVALVLVGMIVVVLATANDVAVMTHQGGHRYLLTHAFSVYGFFVGMSLLLRYRRLVVGYATTEESLRDRTEELRRSHADLEQVQRELSSKKQLAAVGELAAAIAHEVRNPLAIIVNAVAGLRRPAVPEEDRHTLLSIVDEETARLNRLVTDLLRFARPVSLRRSSVALAELVRRAEVNRGTEHKFEILVPDDPDLRTVQADANLLRLVFDNLVANACQSMPEGGTVKIVVTEGRLNEARCVAIEVVDQGHGMDEAVLSRAVDPFFTTRPSGTGLGLPIVQRIVAAHGGAIEMESEPHRGTTVRLLLPMDSDLGESNRLFEGGVKL